MGAESPPPLRRHQGLALEALRRAWSDGARRAWVVLPPGAGKTRVGLETALAMRREAVRTVVLSPNTAIQSQWAAAAGAIGLDSGTERDLAADLTSLTYQAVAVFDADAEADEAGEESPLMSRLHENGTAFVTAMREAGPLLLVLDECHHLLEVWGRLLAELLDLLPDARVLGLTATPPEALDAEQAALVEELFGAVAFETSIPAVVREGDLAPFAELVWLVRPTPRESDWVDGSAVRFHELVTALTDPAFGSVPFLTWCDRRLVERRPETGPSVSWPAVVKAEPALAAAALRLHHAGLLALPPGARPTEEHRREPTADDWVVLVDDWVTGHLARSQEPGDRQALERVRATLPSVGYVLTRGGVRRGRSPVDRVLARSEAKTTAVVQIAQHELMAWGDHRRLLVLCDHERATATLPVDLDGVLAPEAGSAHAVLQALVADPAGEGAVLVTGRTVAGAPATMAALRERVRAVDPALAGRLEVAGAGHGTAVLTGPWNSRTWVPHVTRFFESGRTQVLVGTRGLLGEGWDARAVSGLVDLTSVTTTTAVVQTRGRALRTDPARPDKVAVNWSVVCVSDAHPRGDRDWQRLVRKHAGYFGVDEAGEVVDGVAHIDPAFSPYVPPADADLDAVNARMVVRAEDRAGIRERWRVGEAYDDRPLRTLRVRPRRRVEAAGSLSPEAAAVVVRGTGLEERRDLVGSAPSALASRAGAALAALVVVGAAAAVAWPLLGVLLVVALGAGWGEWRTRAAQIARGRALLELARHQPDVAQMAAAVADALHACGLVSVAAGAVSVVVDRDGVYRCRLTGVPEAESEVFAVALDEALSAMVAPRYVVPRHVVTGRERSADELLALARGGVLGPDGVVWHAVPTVLGTRAARAHAYARALDHWVGCGEPLYTGSPEGAGVLAAQQGSDPFDVATVMRRGWE
ncbi:DEAD/DEAH box helicase family protein [Nocardioides acrostichi]|uniref:DEAD/DEAH box helicase family protein n=1 Tax=Nocardioides acrostichi TaxID=2784339 RepID=A0A930YBS8_9ACTN|nr:DEAD/DEAH box helicase family protein [Nocardioides acrostichi]MBF4162788.1 DEAD/DEAH box helicase family protein [Nocardioides acrostichi]